MAEPALDVVMMSHAETPDLRAMTQRAIATCVAGAGEAAVNIIVLEQQPRCAYRWARTVPAVREFNYNRFANRGALFGCAQWIMVANNDLIFHRGWLRALLSADHPVVSPKCPKDFRQAAYTVNTVGFEIGVHFSGWCFMLRRDLWERIGGFDECVAFWCSDDVVVEQLRAAGVTPMLVPAARVQHLRSVTLNRSPDADELMWRGLDTFNRKYGRDKYADDPRFIEWKRTTSRSSARTAPPPIGRPSSH